MSNKPRFSNAISNIDINSYRAYKNLLNSDKKIPENKFSNSNYNGINPNLLKTNNQDNIKLQSKNLTKHIFNSQSRRFEWQTNEAINRHSELNGAISNLRQKHLNSDNWQGLINLSQDNINVEKTEKYRNFHNLGTRNLASGIRSDYTAKENPVEQNNRKKSCPADANAKQLTKSSSISDLIGKTPENVLPKKKFSNLLNPKTDIFSREIINESTKSGKRTISMENVRDNGDFSGKRYQDMSEIHFINLYKDQSIFRNYLNPSINMKAEGKTASHMKYDKPKLNKYASKVSTDFQSITSNKFY